MATLVAQIQEKLVDVIQIILQERTSERIVERCVDAPVSQVQEVDVPAIMQVKVPAVQVVQKTVEIPQAQVLDEVADTLFAGQHQVQGAEKYRDEDEIYQMKIYAKKHLEKYCVAA